MLDWDAHHGNGTQAIFWTDPSVLYVSLHQYPFYPGTGAASERGEGDGAGATVNLPLAAGTSQGEFLAAFRDSALPALRDFEPGLLLVSAGFDAHAATRSASSASTPTRSRRMTRELRGHRRRPGDGARGRLRPHGVARQRHGDAGGPG